MTKGILSMKKVILMIIFLMAGICSRAQVKEVNLDTVKTILIGPVTDIGDIKIKLLPIPSLHSNNTFLYVWSGSNLMQVSSSKDAFNGVIKADNTRKAHLSEIKIEDDYDTMGTSCTSNLNYPLYLLDGQIVHIHRSQLRWLNDTTAVIMPYKKPKHRVKQYPFINHSRIPNHD